MHVARALFGVTLVVAAVACPAPGPAAVEGAVEGAVERGVALGLFASDPAYDYAPLLDELGALGATHVQLDVVWTQRDARATDVVGAPGITAPDDVIARTIAQARARGMRVTVLPIIRLAQRAPDEWRGTLAPAELAAWFASYGARMRGLAELAERAGAARLVVGSELCSLEHEEARWRALIADVRARFSGALSYAANWDQLEVVAFWDALDEAGASFYFPPAGPATSTGGAVDAAWRAAFASLADLTERAHKPVHILEVGWPSHADAARAPWDETRDAPVDAALQARLYRAFCAALADDRGARAIRGVTFWNWFGAGGPRDHSHTPRHKPAQRELFRCLGG